MATVLDYKKARQVYKIFAPVIAVAAVVPLFFVSDFSPKMIAVYVLLVLLYLFPLLAAKKHIFSDAAKPENVLGSLLGICVYGLVLAYHEIAFFLDKSAGEPAGLIYMPITGVVFWVIIYWAIVIIFRKFDLFNK